jgi:hypothetical protein
MDSSNITINWDAMESLRPCRFPDLKLAPVQMTTGQQMEALLGRRLHVGFVWEPPDVEFLESNSWATQDWCASCPSTTRWPIATNST